MVVIRPVTRAFRLASRSFSTGITEDLASSPFQHLAVGTTRPQLPQFKDPKEHQRHVKEHLAAAFRILAMKGFDEGIAGHLSVRDAVDPETFWVNPWTKSFSQMRASDLVQVSVEGKVFGRRCVDGSATGIHAPIYAMRKDLNGLVHAHGPFTKAFSALGKQLQVYNQDSCAFHQSQCVVKFGGLVESQDEGRRIASHFDENTKIAILLNHGALALGKLSIDDAAWWFVNFEMCAQAQMLIEAIGKSPPEVNAEEREYTKKEIGSPEMGYLSFAAYIEQIDALTKGEYRE